MVNSIDDLFLSAAWRSFYKLTDPNTDHSSISFSHGMFIDLVHDCLFLSVSSSLSLRCRFFLMYPEVQCSSNKLFTSLYTLCFSLPLYLLTHKNSNIVAHVLIRTWILFSLLYSDDEKQDQSERVSWRWVRARCWTWTQDSSRCSPLQRDQDYRWLFQRPAKHQSHRRRSISKVGRDRNGREL